MKPRACSSVGGISCPHFHAGKSWQPLPLEKCEVTHKQAGESESISDDTKVQLKEVLDVLEAAFAKVTSVPCQDLLESYTQLQTMLGFPHASFDSISKEQKAVSEV